MWGVSQSIAIVGSGISGLGAAWGLQEENDVTVFEADDRIGGHSHTVDVVGQEGVTSVDTGFIVYNETTYPLLTAWFDELGVESRPTNMSFALACDRCGITYSGLGATGMAADPRNVVRPGFLAFLADIGRVHRQAPRDPGSGTLENLLDRLGVGATVGRHYVYPLASALWSTGIPDVRRFPARTFIDFFESHRLFRVFGRLQWRTVAGGSRRYVDAALERLPAEVRTGARVEKIERSGTDAVLHLLDGSTARFDRVVVAVHADRALELLADPTAAEVEALSPWRYSESDTWLHSDPDHLPNRSRAHASWIYHLSDCRMPAAGPTMTYNLNRLQGLETDQPVLVTLNPAAQPGSMHLRRRYRHPMFTEASVATQDAIRGLGDDTRTYFCGAHLGYGFHEDGLRSGVEVGRRLGGRFP